MSLRVDPGAFVTTATITGSAGAASTLTITGVAGRRIAVTHIRAMRATNTAEPAGAPIQVTTTNLPGSLAYTVGTVVAAGGQNIDIDAYFDPPLLSSVAGTNTTIVAADPGTNPIWTINCSFYEVAEL